jgi:hypothetical protein
MMDFKKAWRSQSLTMLLFGAIAAAHGWTGLECLELVEAVRTAMAFVCAGCTIAAAYYVWPDNS